MKTSECSVKPFHQTQGFSNSEFSILHYTQNGKLGVGNLGVFSKVYQNSDFFKLLDQTPRFSNSEVFQLRGFPTPSFPFCTTLKTENSEFENLGVWPKYLRVWWNYLRANLRGFQLRLFGFGYSTKRKTRSWKPRKTDSRSFPRTPSFRPRHSPANFKACEYSCIVALRLWSVWEFQLLFLGVIDTGLFNLGKENLFRS